MVEPKTGVRFSPPTLFPTEFYPSLGSLKFSRDRNLGHILCLSALQIYRENKPIY